MKNRDALLRVILLRSLILREAWTLNRYSRRSREDYSFASIFPDVYATGSCAPEQKSPGRLTGARPGVVSISERRDRAVMRGNYSQYSERRSTLCIIVALRVEEEIYPVPSNAAATKAERRREGVVRTARKKRRNRNRARQNRCGDAVAGCSDGHGGDRERERVGGKQREREKNREK